MIATYWDELGNQITVGRSIGSGGEGEVYELVDDPRRVAKIYHPQRGADEAKLQAMVLALSDELCDAAAWPVSILREAPCGRIRGFLMPWVGGREIHDLYQPKARAKYFPAADWKFLVGVGRNLAAALETLHQHGSIVGDFNQRNVRVGVDGFVKFVDCDSFQFRSATGTVFPAAGVAVEDYTPPELQGLDLRTASFKPQHDSFALAVIVFQLLYLGRYPFFSAVSGTAESPSVGAMIRAGNCLLAQPDEAVPPPGVRGITQELASLFVGAFVGKKGQSRPTVGQWRAALEALLRQIRNCAFDSGHVFFSGLENCPWCEFANRKCGAYDPFATVGIQQWLKASVESFAREAKRQLRERLGRLLAATPVARIPKITTSPRPPPRDVEAAFVRLKTASAWRLLPLTKEVQTIRGEVARRREALGLARKQMEAVRGEHERLRALADAAAKNLRTDAELRLAALAELPETFRRELAARQVQSQKEELHAFLGSQLIADARRERRLRLREDAVSSLEGAGISTAAEISEADGPYYWSVYQGHQLRIKVGGIGPKTWGRLVAWRRDLEATFRPEGRLPDAIVVDVKKKAIVKSKRLGAEVASLIERGEAVRKGFDDQLAELQGKIEYAAADIAAAEADWNLIAGLEDI